MQLLKHLSCFFLCQILCWQTVNAQIVDEIDFFRRGVDEIIIEPEFSTVILTASDDQLTRVRGRILGEVTGRQYGFETSIDRKILMVTVNAPLINRNDITGEIFISIPVHRTVKIRSSTGMVSLLNYRSDSVEIMAKSGQVNIDKCTGSFNIENQSGDVILKSSDGDFTVRAAANIKIANTSGAYDLFSKSGHIEADQILADRNSYFQSAKGKVLLNIRQSEAFFSCDLNSPDRQYMRWDNLVITETHYRKRMGKIYLSITASDSLTCGFSDPTSRGQ